MTIRRPVRCADAELSEYAAGRLGDARTRDWDHHLVACECCRRAVAEERRLREALAGGPSMPGDLRLTLLALGRDLEPSPVPAAVGPEPLPLLAPSDPPCHRSPLRATVVAVAAAGASAAAAWSLTVIGAPPVRPGVVSGPTLPVTAPSGGTSGPSGPSTAASFVTVSWVSRTSPSIPSSRQAESTP